MKDIFKILEQNARATPEEIATMTGLDADDVRKRIARAEKDRTIIRYKTMVDWEKLGEEQVWALIEVRVTPQRDVGFDTIARRISRYPEVRSVYLLSGTYDLAVLVAGKTMQQVASFVSQKLAALQSVHGTVSHFLLKRYKEDGEILEDESRSH
ncbi:MAG: Lrp/AsnC family transcriptional regulator [Chloroflexota bacterium]